jgi:uncharacterized protein YecE (DUF72 family)
LIKTAGATLKQDRSIRIGTSGWSIPKHQAEEFPSSGSTLERYASRFSVVEITSSFYKPHRASTYARWAESVPDGFRFSAKLPREITHNRKLANVSELLVPFLHDVQNLGNKLGAVLVQLPPGLRYDATISADFFALLRGLFDGRVACEPRHSTWFTDDVDQMLSAFKVARVAADPPPVPLAAVPGGWSSFVYRRWHGSPTVYVSSYEPEDLAILACNISDDGPNVGDSWCFFDNTMFGEATRNAFSLTARLSLQENYEG